MEGEIMKLPENKTQVIELTEDLIKKEISLWNPLKGDFNKLDQTPFVKYLKLRALRYMTTTMILDMELEGEIPEQKKEYLDKLFKAHTKSMIKQGLLQNPL